MVDPGSPWPVMALDREQNMPTENQTARDGDTPNANLGVGGSYPDRILDERQCREITSLGKTTRWKLMRAGLFPKKVALTPHRSGWRLSAVLAWLKSREAA